MFNFVSSLGSLLRTRLEKYMYFKVASKKNSTICTLLGAAINRVKLSLSDIIPPVTRKSPLKTANTQPKHPKTKESFILTHPKTLEFVKRKDKQYNELQKKAAPFDELANNQKLSKQQNNKENKPQPVIIGKDGMRCITCEGDFGDETMLESQIHWVVCPNCKANHHYGCIKTCKECICGWHIRLQRKMNEGVVVVIGSQ